MTDGGSYMWLWKINLNNKTNVYMVVLSIPPREVVRGHSAVRLDDLIPSDPSLTLSFCRPTCLAIKITSRTVLQKNCWNKRQQCLQHNLKASLFENSRAKEEQRPCRWPWLCGFNCSDNPRGEQSPLMCPLHFFYTSTSATANTHTHTDTHWFDKSCSTIWTHV